MDAVGARRPPTAGSPRCGATSRRRWAGHRDRPGTPRASPRCPGRSAARRRPSSSGREAGPAHREFSANGAGWSPSGWCPRSTSAPRSASTRSRPRRRCSSPRPSAVRSSGVPDFAARPALLGVPARWRSKTRPRARPPDRRRRRHLRRRGRRSPDPTRAGGSTTCWPRSEAAGLRRPGSTQVPLRRREFGRSGEVHVGRRRWTSWAHPGPAPSPTRCASCPPIARQSEPGSSAPPGPRSRTRSPGLHARAAGGAAAGSSSLVAAWHHRRQAHAITHAALRREVWRPGAAVATAEQAHADRPATPGTGSSPVVVTSLRFRERAGRDLPDPRPRAARPRGARGRAGDGLTMTELADRLDVNRTVVHRLVSPRTAARAGAPGATGRAAPGARRRSRRAAPGARRPPPSLPVLRDLAESLRAPPTLYGGRIMRRGSAGVASWPPRGPTDSESGRSRHPLDCGAAGRAILLGCRRRARRRGGPADRRDRGRAPARRLRAGDPVLGGIEGLEASNGIVTIGDIDADLVVPVLRAAAEAAARPPRGRQAAGGPGFVGRPTTGAGRIGALGRPGAGFRRPGVAVAGWYAPGGRAGTSASLARAPPWATVAPWFVSGTAGRPDGSSRRPSPRCSSPRHLAASARADGLPAGIDRAAPRRRAAHLHEDHREGVAGASRPDDPCPA